MCIKKERFPNATELKEWKKTSDPIMKSQLDKQGKVMIKQVKIGGDEVRFYVKVLEWIILLIAFTAALQLQSRDPICSWEDKAGCRCLALAPSWELATGECRDVKRTCCNALRMGAIVPETQFCTCFLSAAGRSSFSV